MPADDRPQYSCEAGGIGSEPGRGATMSREQGNCSLEVRAVNSPTLGIVFFQNFNQPVAGDPVARERGVTVDDVAEPGWIDAEPSDERGGRCVGGTTDDAAQDNADRFSGGQNL